MTAQNSGSEPSSRPSPRSKVELIPWDPDSPEHLERMRLQRVACGWKSDYIEKWRPLQREGKIALQWVIFAKDDPMKDEKLEKHTDAFPEESTPLLDTATSLGGRPMVASKKSFIPVGHISLDSEYESPEFASENRPGLYWIATFYISSVLQRYGLGRAAMDSAEEMASGEPLCAKTLGLSTRYKDDPSGKESSEALGISSELSVQDWYARRGFEVTRNVDDMWHVADSTGKEWTVAAVFMKKEIKRIE